MIISFRHKGLRDFFLKQSTKGIDASHAAKLRVILTALHAAKTIDEVNIPAFRLHPLKGNMKNRWSVWVSGAWRVTFEFNNGDAEIVDYEQYH